jgi:hypothetical protein
LSGHSHTYTLTAATRKQLKQRGLNLVCNRCRRRLRAGEAVISKKGHSHRSSRYYHANCYTNLYV